MSKDLHPEKRTDKQHRETHTDSTGGEDYLAKQESGNSTRKKRERFIVLAIRCKNCETVYSRPFPEYCLKCGRRKMEPLKKVPRDNPNQKKLFE